MKANEKYEPATLSPASFTDAFSHGLFILLITLFGQEMMLWGWGW